MPPTTEQGTRSLTQFEQDYYESNYRNYAFQNPGYKLNFYRRFIEKHLASGLPKRVHSIGCAFGKCLAALGDDWDRYGSDISRFAIQKAASDLPHATFVTGKGATEILFPVSFGLITAYDVLEHVPEVEATPRILASQLVDQGLLVFVVPVYDGLSGPIIRALDKDPTHLHKWDRKRWLHLMENYFDILEWKGIIRYLLPGGIYLHKAVGGIAKYHTPAIIAACRKKK